MKKVLTIAGSDCSGGAGVQADLKTMAAHGVFGMSVIVSVVAENTARVIDIQDISPKMIEEQIDAVFEDIVPDAVKIGMLSSPACMKAVAGKLAFELIPHGERGAFRELRPAGTAVGAAAAPARAVEIRAGKARVDGGLAHAVRETRAKVIVQRVIPLVVKRVGERVYHLPNSASLRSGLCSSAQRMLHSFAKIRR